jgi:hypothetical protein
MENRLEEYFPPRGAAAMTMSVEAIYANGVLKPTQPLPPSVHDARTHGVSEARLVTVWTRTTVPMAAAAHDLRLGAIFRTCDPLGGVWPILPWTGPSKALPRPVSPARNLQDLVLYVMITISVRI